LQKLLHELWVCLILEGPELAGRVPYGLECKLLVYGDKGTVVNGADGKAALIKGLDVQDDGSWSLHNILYSAVNLGRLSNACMSFPTSATNKLSWLLLHEVHVHDGDVCTGFQLVMPAAGVKQYNQNRSTGTVAFGSRSTNTPAFGSTG